jgi:protein-disulfide isomerase
MMGMRGRAEEASVLRIALEVGLDVGQLCRDMKATEIDEHIALSRSLGFSGTPSFVVGKILVSGFVEKAQLQTVVDQTRKPD